MNAFGVEKARSNLDRSRFLICASRGLNDKFKSEQHVQWLAEAGIDFVIGAGSVLVPGQCEEALDLLAKHGLGAIISANPRWSGGDGSNAGKMREKNPLSAYAKTLDGLKKIRNHPAAWQVYICDEPNAVDMPHVGDVVAMFRREVPEVPPTVNLYPNYAMVGWNTDGQTRSQLGTATYEQYVDEYCRDVPIDILTFDYYPYRDNTNNVLNVRQPQMYDNFNVVAKACRRTGRAFWFIAQVVTPPKNTKRLTEENFWFQGLTAMAFGTECVRWALWHHGWWTNSVITVDGVKSDHFEKLKRVNAGLHRIGAPYMRFRNVATAFTGFGGGIKDALGKVGIESRDDFSNGFVQSLRVEDGSPLVIGEMVSRDPVSLRRALFVFAAGDMLGIRGAEHVVRFRSAVKVAAIEGVDGAIAPESAGADGELCFRLRDNRAALIVLGN